MLLTVNHNHCIVVSKFYLLSNCVTAESLVLFVCGVSGVGCKYFCFVTKYSNPECSGAMPVCTYLHQIYVKILDVIL